MMRRRRKEVMRVRIVGKTEWWEKENVGRREWWGRENGGEGSMVGKRKWWVGGRPRRRMGRRRRITKGLERRSVQRKREYGEDSEGVERAKEVQEGDEVKRKRTGMDMGRGKPRTHVRFSLDKPNYSLYLTSLFYLKPPNIPGVLQN